MSGQGAKRWCFTINFKEDNHDDIIMELAEFITKIFGTAADGPQGAVTKYIEYIVAQREKGEKCGTMHIQGFVIFKERHNLTWLHNHFWRGGHYEVARGTNQQCIDYCKKAKTWYMFTPDLESPDSHVQVHRLLWVRPSRQFLPPVARTICVLDR